MNFAKPDQKRQKIVAILLAIVGIILVWQLYELFAGNKTVPKAAAPMATTAMRQPAMAVTPAATAEQLAQNATAPGGDASAAVNPSNNQSAYLRLVNEYQMAQLQRMIAEDNEAIAIAKQNAAKASSETAKLMGGSSLMSTANNTQTNSNDYQLVYTGQQADNSWSATLKKNGQNLDVLVGSQLPDGSRVLSIDDNGVLLQQGTIKKLVTFSGVTQTNTQPGAENKQPQPVAMRAAQAMQAVADMPKLAEADPAIETAQPVDAEKSLPIKAMTAPHAAVTDTPSTLLPVPTKNKAEKADKTEAALTATPDNPTAPAKSEVAAVSKAITKPAVQPAPVAAKTEAAKPVNDKKILMNKPADAAVDIKGVDNNSTVIIQTNKEATEEAPVKPEKTKYNSLPTSNKPINIAQPAVINAIAEPMPAAAAKGEHTLLPLEQPMVAFPKHDEPAAQPKATEITAKTAPVVTPAPTQVSVPAKSITTPAVTVAPVANEEASAQVLTVNPSYYTIQLTGDRELSNLQQFIEKYKLQDKTIYFRTYDMKNRQIYILIYGQYTNSADAKAALAKLPQDVKAEGAFVVKFSTIQTVLKKPAPANK